MRLSDFLKQNDLHIEMHFVNKKLFAVLMLSKGIVFQYIDNNSASDHFIPKTRLITGEGKNENECMLNMVKTLMKTHECYTVNFTNEEKIIYTPPKIEIG